MYLAIDDLECIARFGNAPFDVVILFVDRPGYKLLPSHELLHLSSALHLPVCPRALWRQVNTVAHRPVKYDRVVAVNSSQVREASNRAGLVFRGTTHRPGSVLCCAVAGS